METNSLNLSELSSMEMALKSNKQLAAMIDKKEKEYHICDISFAMTNLGNVNDIEKLSNDHIDECSNIMLKFLLNYQTVIRSSHMTLSSFVRACLKALQLHKLAIDMAEKDKMDKSIRILERCAELANEMAKESDRMIKETTALYELSKYVVNKELTEMENQMVKEMMETESRSRQREMAIKTDRLAAHYKYYGQKMSTFEQTRLFWRGVKRHCEALADKGMIEMIESLNDADLKDLFIEELKNPGLSWLTLGKINYSAQLSISGVDNNILTSLEIIDNDLLCDLLS